MTRRRRNYALRRLILLVFAIVALYLVAQHGWSYVFPPAGTYTTVTP